MKNLKIKIHSEDGLHARPAGLIAKTAGAFKSEILIEYSGQSKNAKSIMSIMSLGLKKDDEISFQAQGEDADEAILAINKLFENNFSL